jgi:hypothetical protein
MKSDWFMYTVLDTYVSSADEGDTMIKQGMTLLSPVWQQQLQQQLLSTAVDSHNSDSTVSTTVPLQLDYTILATVLKLQKTNDTHNAPAVEFLVQHAGFVSYDVLAGLNSTQLKLLNTRGNHTFGVSSELGDS